MDEVSGMAMLKGTYGKAAAGGLLQPEQVTDFAEEAVSRSLQILESELSRLFERPAVSQVHERARHRTVAEQPVRREFVRDLARIEHTIYEDRVAVPISKRRPRPRRVLTDQAQEDRRAHLVFHLDARNRLRRESRAVRFAGDRQSRELKRASNRRGWPDVERGVDPCAVCL